MHHVLDEETKSHGDGTTYLWTLKIKRTGQESALQSLNLSTLWKGKSLLLIHSQGHWDTGKFYIYSCSTCSQLCVEFRRIPTLKVIPNSEISGLPTLQHCFRWPSLWFVHQTLIGVTILNVFSKNLTGLLLLVDQCPNSSPSSSLGYVSLSWDYRVG